MLAYKYDNDEDKVDAVIEADRTLRMWSTLQEPPPSWTELPKGYTEAEIKAIAKYFAALPFKAQKQDVNVEQAQAGASIHENHCEKCHEDGGPFS